MSCLAKVMSCMANVSINKDKIYNVFVQYNLIHKNVIDIANRIGLEQDI